jgi:linoleate 10R-lipoxygenase
VINASKPADHAHVRVAANLTTWGYLDTKTNPDDGSYGGMLTRLLFRHLPEYYPPGSAYAHFPFIVPDTMKKYAEKWQESVVGKYTWTKPALPTAPALPLERAADVNYVLSNPSLFDDGFCARLTTLTRNVGIDRSLVRIIHAHLFLAADAI